ncbi:mitochondrial import inner membrane translocase subunit Tim54 [Circinella umbellata]|nr:mitochondrial import inner membrane translocase subunit Tim54 [Circinella umbellata]
MSKLPFGLKAPSKGTVIFCSVLGTISGTIYASTEFVKSARKAHCDKVSFLADRPCGVHEMPRKVCVYLMPPPGDSIEKSRAWFREYVKPILVAGAVDYDVMEGQSKGAVESSVCNEIKRLRREEATAHTTLDSSSTNVDDSVSNQEDSYKSNPFAPVVQDVQKKIEEQKHYDGVIAIGRLAWREVLSGVAKGCHADPFEEPPKAVEEKKEEGEKLEQEENKAQSSEEEQQQQPAAVEENNMTFDEQPKEEEHAIMTDLADSTSSIEKDQQQHKDHFSIPRHLSPVIYIPHENIIGWTNIPYRLYRWITDYTRVEWIGQYAVDTVLNEKRPLQIEDLDMGESEKKYWIGEEAEAAVKEDVPITLEDKVRTSLSTYTNKNSS